MRFPAVLSGVLLTLTASLNAWAQSPPPNDPQNPPNGAAPAATGTSNDASAAAPPTGQPPNDKPAPSGSNTAVDNGAAPPNTNSSAPPQATPPKPPEPNTFQKLMSGFSYGSYGRVIAAGDFRGRPGRDTDFVARGSRLDESNYVELELRREDYWEKTQSRTRIVTTLALANPIFHYSGDFDAVIAIRNMFIESRDLGLKRLSVWAGSRMYRGDDVYLLDFWPMDSLNTLGGGARYDFKDNGWTNIAVHAGVNRPNGLFYYQTSQRTAPNNAFGATTVEILNRQRTIGSVRLQHIFPVGERGGIKGVLYGEFHGLSAGQRETDPEVFEDVPAENGFVVGAQVGGFTGFRDTHLNLFFRYARGLAAYGEFASPTRLSLARTTEGASEVRLAVGGNYETGPFGLMLGGYMRSFRNASAALDNDDIDEGAIILRPHFFIGESGGIAVEGSFQAQQRGVLFTEQVAEGETPAAPKGPLMGSMFRFGIIPFLSPGGRGDFSRPHFRIIYLISVRDKGAQALYPKDDVFGIRDVEHFLGFGAEWWFNSSSYGW